MKLKEKVALITGASRGIGRAIALLFAKEGAKVIVNYVHSKEKAEEVVSKIRKLGSDAISIKADVSNLEELKFLVEKSIEKFGRIDILVNNAGVYFRNTLEESTEEIWDKTINIDLRAPYFLSKLVSKYMLEQKSGKIINIASIAGIKPRDKSIEYQIAKAGVITMTKALSLALAPYINVNCISPGHTMTDMTGYDKNPEKKKRAENNIPLKRIGQPEDIAKAALFLASSDSDYITGANIVVDGGRSLN
jgi:3-oxoacyl-[acyl-carrier protein] reductase